MPAHDQPKTDASSLEAYADSIMALAEAIPDPDARLVFLKLAYVATLDRFVDFHGDAKAWEIDVGEGFHDRLLKAMREADGMAELLSDPIDTLGGKTARLLAERAWWTRFSLFADALEREVEAMQNVGMHRYDASGLKAAAAWAADGIEATQREYDIFADRIGPVPPELRTYLKRNGRKGAGHDQL